MRPTRTADEVVADGLSEKAWQQQVIAEARVAGWTLQYHTWRSDHSPRGFPDLVLLDPAGERALVIECKRQSGKVSPEQQCWLDAWNAIGVLAIVARPRDRAWLIPLLEARQ